MLLADPQQAGWIMHDVTTEFLTEDSPIVIEQAQRLWRIDSRSELAVYPDRIPQYYLLAALHLLQRGEHILSTEEREEIDFIYHLLTMLSFDYKGDEAFAETVQENMAMLKEHGGYTDRMKDSSFDALIFGLRLFSNHRR